MYVETHKTHAIGHIFRIDCAHCLNPNTMASLSLRMSSIHGCTIPHLQHFSLLFQLYLEHLVFHVCVEKPITLSINTPSVDIQGAELYSQILAYRFISKGGHSLSMGYIHT